MLTHSCVISPHLVFSSMPHAQQRLWLIPPSAASMLILVLVLHVSCVTADSPAAVVQEEFLPSTLEFWMRWSVPAFSPGDIIGLTPSVHTPYCPLQRYRLFPNASEGRQKMNAVRCVPHEQIVLAALFQTHHQRQHLMACVTLGRCSACARGYAMRPMSQPSACSFYFLNVSSCSQAPLLLTQVSTSFVVSVNVHSWQHELVGPDTHDAD